MRWTVRVARPEDLAEVMALERSLPELPHWQPGEYAKYVRPEIAGGERLLVIAAAESDGAMLGFAAAVWRPPPVRLAELESVGVNGAARRLGVARSLCRCVLDWAGAQGAAAMELEVRSGSAGARALYESLGFAASGGRAGYYRDPVEDALLMSRRLDGARKAE